MEKRKSILILLAVIFAIVGLFWFAGRFGGSEKVQSEKPAVVCKGQECFWTAHIHATIKVFAGGREVPLNFEQGKLEEEHTHSDSDKLHWHGLIPIDPKTQEVKDWSALEVGKIPADLNLSLEGKPRFVVNSKEVEESYVWRDGDLIEIHYP